jgi:hypothetical protein
MTSSLGNTFNKEPENIAPSDVITCTSYYKKQVQTEINNITLLSHCYKDSQIIRSMLPLTTKDDQKLNLKLLVTHIALMININSAKCRAAAINTHFTFRKFRVQVPLTGNQENE